MKEKGELAFGQLPLARFLTASGDTVVSVVQCRAIMHAVGKMSIGSETPIGSDDLKTSAMIDELIDFEEDLFAALRMTMYPTRFCHDAFKDDDAKLARRAKICEEVLNPKLAMLEAKLIANGSKWAAGTETPTIADFLIFTSLYGLTTGNIDGGTSDMIHDGNSPTRRRCTRSLFTIFRSAIAIAFCVFMSSIISAQQCTMYTSVCVRVSL